MTEGTCVVGIHASTDHGVQRAAGHVLFRALALRCDQHGPWRETRVAAEYDAVGMDAHRCPEAMHEGFARIIPFDRLRTPADALLAPTTALRYVPDEVLRR